MDEKTSMEYDKRIEQINERIRNKFFEEVDRAAGKASRELAQAELEHGVVREDVFQYFFLPFFAGVLTEEQLQEHNHLQLWLNIAGAPTNKVDVVDEQNNILFTVPPLHDTGLLDMTGMDLGHSMMSVKMAIDEIGAVRPNQAKRILHSELNKRMPQHSNKRVHDFYVQWKNIYERYGYLNKDIPKEDNDNGELDGLIEDWY